MVERETDHRLSEILKAASDPTRRAILTLLVQHGPTRVTDLAAEFDMSLNAVSKHIKVLEQAGLASRRTSWREHLIEAQMEPLAEIDRWFRDLRLIWDMRLEALETLLTKESPMTTATDADLRLTVTRLIPAPPERVFNAWLDPTMLARFMVPCAGGHASAETDPRVGGRYTIVMNDGEKDIPHHGTYREITPHRHLAFTWNSPHAAPDSTVEIDFAPEAGGTRLTLTHVKFRSPESRDGHNKGWTAILANLDGLFA